MRYSSLAEERQRRFRLHKDGEVYSLTLETDPESLGDRRWHAHERVSDAWVLTPHGLWLDGDD